VDDEISDLVRLHIEMPALCHASFGRLCHLRLGSLHRRGFCVWHVHRFGVPWLGVLVHGPGGAFCSFPFRAGCSFAGAVTGKGAVVLAMLPANPVIPAAFPSPGQVSVSAAGRRADSDPLGAEVQEAAEAGSSHDGHRAVPLSGRRESRQPPSPSRRLRPHPAPPAPYTKYPRWGKARVAAT
jgi:hypothetical protein